ncbi:unnamed protein product [Meganyctiphanes norvegica]|uniref:39S ribosomal protein L12, mitochondrial n=1 Tax=Meganyctiphanes norvegica TaxID=48144 RepID=A0AAV2RV04_MEGNR
MQAVKLITSYNYSALTCGLRHKLTRIPVAAVVNGQHRLQSAEAAAIPSPEGAPKVYAPKIESIVHEITNLTLVEVADLNELLKKTLNISDAPMMAVGAAPALAAKEEEEEEEVVVQKVQTSFTVKMTAIDATKKIPTIKAIKSVMEGMNLVQAKKFVESVPAVVRADISKDEAEKLKEELAAVGATIEIE